MAYLKFNITLFLFIVLVLPNRPALSQPRRIYIAKFSKYIGVRNGNLQELQEIEGTARLENGKVNLTSFFTTLERSLEQSPIENTYWINNLDFFSGRLLCETLPQDRQIRACKEDLERTIETQKTRFLERQSQRLLYPERYHPLKRRNDEDDFNEFLMNLRQLAGRQNNLLCKKGVENFCQGYENRKFFLYSSSRQYEQVLRTLNSSGLTRDCLEAVLEEQGSRYSSSLFSRMPQTCQGLSGTDQEVCQGMKNDFSVFQERIKNIMTNIKPGNEHAKQPYTDPLELKSGILDFMGKQHRHRDTVNCPYYTLGEERIPSHLEWDLLQNNRLLSVRKRYSVKREQDGNYTVTIPMIFSAGEDYDGSTPKEQVHAHYLEQTRRYMDELRPYLLGPNGEQLRIVIADGKSPDLSPSDPLSCLTPLKVTIEDRRQTANAGTYPSDVDRLTTIHELGHIIGDLDDEYGNVSYGHSVDVNGRVIRHVRGGYKCRVLQTNSFMASPYTRFKNIRNGNNSSLLDPTHFNVILYGTCQTKPDVKLYHQCSSLAYNTNFNNLDCPPLKAQCESSNVLGRKPYQNRDIQGVANENERAIRELQNLDDCSRFQGRVRFVGLHGIYDDRSLQILPLEAINFSKERENDSCSNDVSYELRFIDLNDTSKGVQKVAVYRRPSRSVYDIWQYGMCLNRNEQGMYYTQFPFQLNPLDPNQRNLSNCWVKMNTTNISFETDQSTPATPRQAPRQGSGTR